MEDKEWEARRAMFTKVKFADPLVKRENFMVNLRKENRRKIFKKKRSEIQVPSLSDAYDTSATEGEDYTPWDPNTKDVLEDLLNVLKNTWDKGYCFEACHDKKLLTCLSEYLSDYINSPSIVGTQQKELIVCVTLKILLDMTALEGYSDTEFVNYSYQECKFSILLRKLIMKACEAISNLGPTIGHESKVEEVYRNLGFIQRSIAILQNYLCSNKDNFYDDIAACDMHECFHTMFLVFSKNAPEIEYNYMEDTYELYADMIYCTNVMIHSFPSDSLATSLDCIEIIIKSIFQGAGYSDIKVTKERYQDLIFSCCAAIESVCSTQEDGLAKFCDEKSKIVQIVEIANECLAENSKANIKILIKISKLIKTLSEKSYDQKYEDAKLFPCLFNILNKVNNPDVEEYLTDAIIKFLGNSRHILEDLSNAKNLKFLLDIGAGSTYHAKSNIADIFTELMILKKLNSLCDTPKNESIVEKYINSQKELVDGINSLSFNILEDFQSAVEAQDNALKLVKYLVNNELVDPSETLHRLEQIVPVSTSTAEDMLEFIDFYREELSDFDYYSD
ncbi:unnamed protein product [Moneuplotes crassus]|uniref:Uncharacterized protein n=1 Tax=Euplotes crassus TaxID=5936 RepID=A0AAD1U8Y7_EUPCR|nr:unnamed protein product [Moneuplotes crassus]